ncbi:MAG: hypothetical protein AABN34_04000 [Acidobacteriota bacterium]
MSQSPVNIVYPINGATYPISDPDCKVKSAYFTASFSTTCAGGPHAVKWGFGTVTLGDAKFYDQFSGQFTWKLPAGAHNFWVKSDCGQADVKFKIG